LAAARSAGIAAERPVDLIGCPLGDRGLLGIGFSLAQSARLDLFRQLVEAIGGQGVDHLLGIDALCAFAMAVPPVSTATRLPRP
jgi:hypothetical protein